jgi:acyl-CoA thioester hydrolase
VTSVPLYVRFADVDMMRIVHHTAYLHWFEQLRFHFLEVALGLDYETLSREGLRFPLVGCTVEFRKPVVFGARPVGHVRLEYGKTSLFVFHYEITDGEDGSLYARATTTHCCVDQELKLRVSVPPVLQDAVARARGAEVSGLSEGAPRFPRQR